MRQRQKRRPQESSSPTSPGSPKLGAREGGFAPKAQLPGGLEGADRYPQHSGEIEDARKD